MTSRIQIIGRLSSCLEQGIGSSTRSFSSSISDEAKSAIQKALSSLQQGPVSVLNRVASLAVQSAAYRDMHLASLSLREQMSPAASKPLVEAAASSSSPTAASPPPSPSHHTIFPVLDLTKLPDDHPSVPQHGQKLEQKYMDKTTAWMALQPNHIETSRMLQSSIYLFPPQEAAYPTFIDIDAAVKALEYRKSRRRLKLLKYFQKRQDKYQLDIWQHRPGHR